ncbi:MAG: threonyl-tRNA synthetase editing domain-containing protein [Deltaproteobacteria bacterium]|nr:threonyl-tRNA synthetase editing domain-containing protein [Deltaproteobacteria bacterium]
MKLLMIYTDEFGYKTSVKNLESASTSDEEKVIENALLGFIHVEPKDEENMSSIETKLIKNLKWAARKNETDQVILHSFAHLAEGKANPEVTKQLLDNAESRLINAGYVAYQTPFGYFLDLDIKAPGHSFSRLFKEF